MKLNKNQSSLVLVFMIFINTKIIVYSAAIGEPVVTEDSAIDHHDHNQNTFDHHPPNPEEHADDQDIYDEDDSESVEVTIKGHGEDCTGDNVQCTEGLECLEGLEKCDCSAGTVFSSTLGKCHSLEAHSVQELHNSHDEHNHHSHVVEVAETPTTPKAALVLTSAKTESKVVLDQSLEDEDHVSDTVHEMQHEHASDNNFNKCENENCVEIMGNYSKCDENTGKCICHDTEQHNRPLILVNGKCWIHRKINDPCTSHEQCAATIKGHAWCHTEMKTLQQYCQCEMFHYFDETLKECLKFAEDGLFSPCKTDTQCTGLDMGITGHGLGPNARCNSQKSICECKLGPDDQKGFLYENYCFYELKVGDQCIDDKECQLSLSDSNAFCSAENRTCSEGEPMGGRMIGGTAEATSTSDSDGFMKTLKSSIGIDIPNFVFIMIIAAVVVLIVVIAAVFILRKRHKYTMVRTRDNTDQNRT